MKIKSTYYSRWGFGCLSLFLGVLLASCSSISFISSYDEPTDKALTEIQQSSDDFIGKLIAHASTEDNSFAKHQIFYQDADQKLRRLEFRVTSIPSNMKTVKLVEDIRAVIVGSGDCNPEGASLRDLHCSSTRLGPSKAALEISRRSINQTIGAALALEIAKKTGD